MTLPLAVYLSFKEFWRNRARFFLVSLVIALITILVLFIAGLGEGLGTNNRQYLENLDAQLVVFRDKADFVIPASRLEQTAAAQIREIEGVADAGGIATSGVAIMLPDDEVLKVALLGVEPGRPGAPEALQGQSLSESAGNEVVIDQNVIDRTSIKIGDTIRVRSNSGRRGCLLRFESDRHHRGAVLYLPAAPSLSPTPPGTRCAPSRMLSWVAPAQP